MTSCAPKARKTGNEKGFPRASADSRSGDCQSEQAISVTHMGFPWRTALNHRMSAACGLQKGSLLKDATFSFTSTPDLGSSQPKFAAKVLKHDNGPSGTSSRPHST